MKFWKRIRERIFPKEKPLSTLEISKREYDWKCSDYLKEEISFEQFLEIKKAVESMPREAIYKACHLNSFFKLNSRWKASGCNGYDSYEDLVLYFQDKIYREEDLADKFRKKDGYQKAMNLIKQQTQEN